MSPEEVLLDRLARALGAAPPCTREHDGNARAAQVRAAWEARARSAAEEAARRVRTKQVRMKPPASGGADGARRLRDTAEGATRRGVEGVKRAAQALRADAHIPRECAQAWRTAVRAYVKGWLAEHGLGSAWQNTLIGLAAVCARTGVKKVPLERAAALARVNAKAWGALERDPPWLAAQAVKGAEANVVRGPRAQRLAWAVEQALEEAGDPGPCSVEEAARAYEGWRWPRVAPPLALAHWCARTGAPLESDGEWALAMRGPRGEGWRAVSPAGACTLVRTHAAKEPERVRAKVARSAHAARIAGGASRKRWERWRARWAVEPALEGEGALAMPTLVDAGDGRLGWQVTLDSPEAVICLAARHGMAPTLEVGRTSAMVLHLGRGVEIAERIPAREGRCTGGGAPRRWSGCSMPGEIERALFVDVDGVLITERSWIRHPRAKHRPRFDPLGAQIVAAICERCAATLVWNTTHAMYRERGQHGLEAMARAVGLERYTRSGGARLAEGDTTRYRTGEDTRLGAIEAWLRAHAREDAAWCALDDAAIADPRALRVDAAVGVTATEYRAATRLLGRPHEPLILL